MPRRDAVPRLLAACLLLTLPTAAAAQADLPIYAFTAVKGELTTAHPTSDNSFHQHYLYEGSAGQRIRVEVESEEFEVAVALYAPGGGGKPLADDPGEDWGLSWAASVVATLTARGQYVVCIHSHEARRIGKYDVWLTN